MQKILKLIFSNLLFKIFAIILAISVWGVAVLFRTQTVSTLVPIEFINLSRDLIITKTNTDKINVNFQGKGTDFVKFLLQPPKYRLDLAMAKVGLNRIKFVPDEFLIAAPVLIKLITPEYAELNIDNLDTKKVDLNIPYRLEPQKGIYITNVKTKDTVILFGPKQDIKFIKELSTESLFVSDYSALEITQKLPIIVRDPKIFWVRPDSITVIASLEKEENKTFFNIPTGITISSLRSATVTPKTAQITVHGAASQVQILQSSDIKVTVNCLKLTPGTHKIPAEIMLPKGIFLVRCEPQLFEVKIR